MLHQPGRTCHGKVYIEPISLRGVLLLYHEQYTSEKDYSAADQTKCYQK